MQSNSDLYKPIGRRVLDQAAKTFQDLGKERVGAGFVDSFLSQHVGQVNELEGLQHVALLLDPPTKPAKLSQPPGRVKRLSNRNRKALGLHRIPKDEQKYKLYEPLHQLWVGYMNELLQPSYHSPPMQLAQKVLKADFHGCILKVSRSRCSSLIGAEGIVLQETQNTIKLINKHNKLKSDHLSSYSCTPTVCRDHRKFTAIPKAGCVFQFSAAGHQFTLYGDNLRFRTADRSARKFKDKPTIDL